MIQKEDTSTQKIQKWLEESVTDKLKRKQFYNSLKKHINNELWILYSYPKYGSLYVYGKFYDETQAQTFKELFIEFGDFCVSNPEIKIKKFEEFVYECRVRGDIEL
jgi:hypothetical protein